MYEYLEYLLDTIYRTPKSLLDVNKLLPWSQEMQSAWSDRQSSDLPRFY
ncbi:hypothetical protein ACQRDF_05570 [Lachnospiraceae bacterium SGI.054]